MAEQNWLSHWSSKSTMRGIRSHVDVKDDKLEYEIQILAKKACQVIYDMRKDAYANEEEFNPKYLSRDQILRKVKNSVPTHFKLWERNAGIDLALAIARHGINRLEALYPERRVVVDKRNKNVRLYSTPKFEEMDDGM